MRLAKNFSVLTILLVVFSITGFAAGNPIDSDLSNTAGTNSGKSHLDIYIFIVLLLIACVVVPFIEGKNKKASSK